MKQWIIAALAGCSALAVQAETLSVEVNAVTAQGIGESVGNVKIEVRGNGNMATKQAAGRTKIDPVIAMLCAAILMSWNPEASSMNLDDFLSAPVMAMR